MQPDELFLGALRKWIDVFMRRSMLNFIHYSKGSGLSMSQIGALFYIHHRGACGVSEVGDDLGVTSAAASQMLERLVHQNLISRSEDPRDRRVKQILLTPRGRQVLRDSLHARQHWLGGLANSLNEDEKEQIRLALNILIEKANRLEAQPEPER
jgi:DNA-binding MarR family transcriptional regulator